MSATTSKSTATSIRAISRIRLIAACVSGASAPLLSISASIFFASGERTPMPVDERDRVADERGDHPEVPQPRSPLITIAMPIRSTIEPGRSEELLADEGRLARERRDLARVVHALGAEPEERDSQAAADPERPRRRRARP